MCKIRFVDNPEESPSDSQFAALGTRFHEWANVFFDAASEVDPNQWVQLIPHSFNAEERRWAMNFIRFEQRRWRLLKAEGRLAEWFPVARELYLTSTELGIEGHIDRVDWYDRSQQLVVLVEYKCTLSMDITSLRRQLHFYKLLYEHADQPTIGKVVGIACINPRLNEIWYENVNPWSEAAVKKRLQQIRFSLANNVWPKTKNLYVCMFCDLADSCDIWEEVESDE